MELKLIIADDAPFIREVFRHLLEKTGMVLVGEASNGEDAVRLALEKRPDVILMDIVMPSMSGIEATQKILEEWPQAKIIACSTMDQDHMVEKALQAGCRKYLKKPFDSNEVIEMIHQVASES